MRSQSCSTSLFLVALLTCLPLAAATAQSCNPRHFYNQSDLTWTIEMQGGGACTVGSSTPQAQCSVGPKETAILNYNGSRALFMQSSVFFNSFPLEGCDYLWHHGDTGNVALNRPADGDVQTCGAPGYSCVPSLPSNCPTRHFQNNSNLNWTFLMLGDGSCTKGSIPAGRQCTVAPGESIALNYANGAAGGAITLESGVYYQTFQVNGCYVMHQQGNTGNVSLNDPNDGDVQTCSGECGARK